MSTPWTYPCESNLAHIIRHLMPQQSVRESAHDQGRAVYKYDAENYFEGHMRKQGKQVLPPSLALPSGMPRNVNAGRLQTHRFWWGGLVSSNFPLGKDSAPFAPTNGQKTGGLSLEKNGCE